MFLGLGGNGFADDRFQIIVRGPLPQGSAEVGFLVGKDAGPEFSVRGQPKPIAGRAKMLTHGADQPDLSPGPGIGPPSGRTVEAMAVNRPQVPQSLKPVQDPIPREETVRRTARGRPDRHKFNETYMIRFFEGKAPERQDFIFVDALQGHDIDLDGVETDGLGCLNPFPNLME